MGNRHEGEVVQEMRKGVNPVDRLEGVLEPRTRGGAQSCDEGSGDARGLCGKEKALSVFSKGLESHDLHVRTRQG